MFVWKLFFVSAFKCLSWITKQKHLDAQQKLIKNEQSNSVSQDLVFVKISLIRTAYAKGKWTEVSDELICTIFPT